MAKVVVTGASGFIGRALVPAIRSQGHEVVAETRRNGAGSRSIDLEGPSSAWEHLLGSSDVVIHLAGRAHDVRRHTPDQADEYRRVNALGAERVARAAASAHAERFIQVSTVKVLGDQPVDGVRFREDDPLRPNGIYAESKAEGERLVALALEQTSTEFIVVRLPLVFGQPFKGNLATLERAISRGVPLPLGHPTVGRRSYVMLPDLVSLLITLIDCPAPLPPVLHARSGDFSAAEVARMIGNEIHRRPRIVSVPAQILRAGAATLGRPELASKLCDEMLVSDEVTRRSLSQLLG